MKIVGMAPHPINAGESLTVTTDALKWRIPDGWVPGMCKVNVRVDNLSLDRNRCILSVHSEPFAVLIQ